MPARGVLCFKQNAKSRVCDIFAPAVQKKRHGIDVVKKVTFRKRRSFGQRRISYEKCAP